MMVYEDLQEVLNSDHLLVAKLKMLVLLALELLTMGRVVNHGLDDAEGHVGDVLHGDRFVVILASFHRSESRRRLRLPLQLALFQQLRSVHLQQVDLLTDIVDLGVDHHKGLLVPPLALNVDLHEQLPALLLLSQGDGVLPCGVLLAAHFDGRVDVEDGSLFSVLDVQEVFDSLFFVLLHVAIQQECCVVFVVVDVALCASLRLLFVTDQPVEVLDQVVELSDLDVVLDDVARIQEPNRLDVLLDSLIVLLLVKQLVSMLLNNLALDLTWEIRLFCDGLRLSVV